MKLTHKPFWAMLLIAAALNVFPILGVVTAQEATAQPTEPIVVTPEATSAATEPALTPEATQTAQATEPALTPEATQTAQATEPALTPEATEPVAGATEAAAAVEWSYTGKTGPSHWGDLSPDWALCGSGSAQSPIDILAPTSQSLAPIQFNYQSSALRLLNNGHTIQVGYAPGSTITLDDTTYTLQQIDFHHPSEHTINGVVYPMELDFVHADASGSLAIVAVLVQEGGQDNPAFADIFSNLPAHANDTKTVADKTINASDMLPTQRVYYRYSGSLMTPPCTEGVQWLVLAAPISLSPAQIAKFTHLYAMNVRPVQALNDRVVAVSSGG